MVQPIDNEDLEELEEGFFEIDPEDVLRNARNQGLKVSTLEDFRNQTDNYEQIENLMNRYIRSYARYSALGGATSGIGGISTSITLSSLEMAQTAVQLYRLSQRFAILNGFDPRHPMHQDDIYSIYLNTLGFKATAQAAIKYFLIRASDTEDNRSITTRLFSSVVTRIARKVGSDISSRKLSRLVPVVGGAVGAYASYNYATDTGHSMRDAFKKQYYLKWHDIDIDKK